MIVLGVVAAVFILANIILLSINLDKIKELTGQVTRGEVNVTVGGVAVLNFTTWQVNLGSGAVDEAGGFVNATVSTKSGVSLGGSGWSTGMGGLVIENTGNVNLSLGLKGDHNAANLIGGTNPQYQWLLSGDPSDAEDNSCKTYHTGSVVDTWYDVNSTQGFCDKFQPNDAADSIMIHFKFVIALDASTGARGDNITAIFSAT